MGLRLGDVDRGSDPALIAAVGKLERFFVRPDGRIEKLLLRIEAAQLEVVESEFGLKAQVHAGEVRGGRLGFGTRSFDGAADASPDVGFPGDIDGRLVIVVGERRSRAEESAILRLARARCGSIAGQCRIIGGAIGGDGGAGDDELSLRFL